ncbi:MAG: hypothetical protein ACO3JL_04195 [Myxococcota bacterium]
MKRIAFSLVVAVFGASAVLAEGEPADVARRARIERLRDEHARELHLYASDLLDELVLAYKAAPPFGQQTAVVLADVTAPLGYGSGLEAMLENHFTELLLRHPEANLTLVHCPACHAVTTHSDRRATVIGKGIDQPAALRALGIESGSLYALFLDFEAEGPALVLRARIVSLTESLPLVHARTLTTSTSVAPLLRSGDFLVTADQARREYLDALASRGPFTIPLRFAVSAFAPGVPSFDEFDNEGVNIPLPPLLWLQTGAEFAFHHSRAFTGSFIVGGTYVPLLYSGYMVQGRIHRLLTGSEASLRYPNLYLFGGGSLVGLHGPVTLLLEQQPSLNALYQSLGGDTGPTFYPAAQAGLDLRLGNRVAIAVYGESAPTLQTVGDHLNGLLLFVPVTSVGMEVSLCF